MHRMNNSYWGEIVALLTALSWSIGVFPFTEASRRMNPNAVNHFRMLLAMLSLGILLMVLYPLNLQELFTSVLPQHWFWFGLSGLVGLALGDYFGFTSYAILGTRLASVFSTLAPGAALILSYFMLNETINFLGIAGMAITISGIVWINMSKKEQSKIAKSTFGSTKKGIVMGILAALCQGFGLVFAKMGMSFTIQEQSISSIHATFIRLFVSVVVTYGLTISRGKLKEVNRPILQNQNNGLKYLIAGTLFGPTLGVVLSMYAVSLINVSVAQTLFSLVPVMVLPLAVFFYHEKISLKSALGAAVAIAGVVILIWRNELMALLTNA